MVIDSQDKIKDPSAVYVGTAPPPSSEEESFDRAAVDAARAAMIWTDQGNDEASLPYQSYQSPPQHPASSSSISFSTSLFFFAPHQPFMHCPSPYSKKTSSFRLPFAASGPSLASHSLSSMIVSLRARSAWFSRLNIVFGAARDKIFTIGRLGGLHFITGKGVHRTLCPRSHTKLGPS